MSPLGDNGRAWRRGSDRRNMAGGERAVQRETVKASRPVSLAGDQPPAAGPPPATALISQTSEQTMQTISNGPERPTGAISARPATTLAKKNRKRTGAARKAAVAELRRIRAEAEAEVERLLALLDQLDGYPDDEPSLGFVENHPFGQDGGWGGWPYYSSQGRQDVDQGTDDDREGDEHDGREPDCDDEDGGDDEPSLGWPADMGSRGITSTGALGEALDLESDPAEMGIADHDGLLEQVAGHHPGYGPAGFARAAL